MIWLRGSWTASVKSRVSQNVQQTLEGLLGSFNDRLDCIEREIVF